MRYLIILLFLIPVTGSAQVTANEDEFTGQKTIVLETPIQIEAEEHDGYGSYYNAGYTEGNYLMAFISVSDSWQFLEANNAYFLIDGERMQKKIHIETEMEDMDELQEIAVTPMSEEEFNSIANAEEFRIKINESTFNISKDKRDVMHEIIEKAE